jgi:hypothetical protein
VPPVKKNPEVASFFSVFVGTPLLFKNAVRNRKQNLAIRAKIKDRIKTIDSDM